MIIYRFDSTEGVKYSTQPPKVSGAVQMEAEVIESKEGWIKLKSDGRFITIHD
jgi:hypothetical protein